MKIKITLTQEQYELLTSELFQLQIYRENDDHIHYDDCMPESLSIIETQHEEVAD